MVKGIETGLDAALEKKWRTRHKLLRRLLHEVGPTEDKKAGTGSHRTRGYTPEQFTIIMILADFGHGVRISEIAGAVDVPHANISRTLDRLEEKGLVLRKRGRDRREVLVRLTLEGNKAAGRLRDVERKLRAEIWGNYDRAEQETLLELLTRT